MKNKIIAGVVLVVGLLLGYFGFHQASPLVGGGDVRNVGEFAPNGIGFGNLPVTWSSEGGKILAKSNTAFWKNVTGKTQYVDYVEVSTDNFASSSMKIYAFSTSTAVRTLYDFVAPAQQATTTLLINAFTIATSSQATTTTNIDKAFSGKTAIVPNNSLIVIQMQTANGAVCASSGSGICESATSTNRGFNLQWRIRFHD